MQETKKVRMDGRYRIRHAVASDVDRINEIYEKILAAGESGRDVVGWVRGGYPTRDTALLALDRGDLFVYEEDGPVEASGIINQKQMDSYAQGAWKIAAAPKEVMVLHTLVVDPEASGRGIAHAFVSFYEQYARDAGCRVLRIDTQEKNAPARSLYHKLGFSEADILDCDFNGIPGIRLVLLEKGL